MALSELQKTKIRMYLGYSASTGIYSQLEYAMDSLSASEETQIGTLLTDLDSLFSASTSTATGSRVKRADDVEFFSGAEALVAIKTRIAQIVEWIASILGVVPNDSQNQSGGVIPLG